MPNGYTKDRPAVLTIHPSVDATSETFRIHVCPVCDSLATLVDSTPDAAAYICGACGHGFIE